MKYYINLIKRKKYLVILAGCLIGCIGVLMIFVEKNIESILIGSFMIYIGFVYFPVTHIEAQDDNDYIVEGMGEDVYIKFKKKEYVIKKETLLKDALGFRDKNGKFIGFMRSTQISSYVLGKHEQKICKNIDKENILNTNEIVKKFNNIKIMDNERKLEYMKYKKIKNKKGIISTLLATMFFIIFIIFLLGIILAIIEKSFGDMCFSIVASIIFFFISKGIYRLSIRNKILYKKIMDGNAYMADCYPYDRKLRAGEEYTYFIKVTDKNNHYIDQWIEITQEIYQNHDAVKIKLVIIEYYGEQILDVIKDCL